MSSATNIVCNGVNTEIGNKGTFQPCRLSSYTIKPIMRCKHFDCNLIVRTIRLSKTSHPFDSTFKENNENKWLKKLQLNLA